MSAKAAAEEKTQQQQPREAQTPATSIEAKKQAAFTGLPGRIQNLASSVKRIDLDGVPGDLFTLPIAALRELPESCQNIAVIRASLNSSLIGDFGATLSPPEREQVAAYNCEGFMPLALGDKWDHYLRNEAVQQWGARLLLSDHVMARVWAWAAGEKDGIWNLEMFFNEILKSARVERKYAKGQITPQARRAKDPFVAEIKELQRRVRSEWPETPGEVRELVAREVENSPPFWQLKKNAPQLINFLADDQIALDFRGDEEHPDSIMISPAQFFVKWLAASKNRPEEPVRQDLTKVR
jgi:hypothetical protein